MKIAPRDTIVAVSSPPIVCHGQPAVGCPCPPPRGDIPRAIIRLSGRDAFALAEQVFAAHEEKLSQLRGWRHVAGEVRWREHRLPAAAWCMRSPHTYTREDIVELHLSGLPWPVSALLEKLIAAGARLAQPGEFTRRAFENGRISLDQAAAVADLILSHDASEARAHAARLASHAYTQRRQLRDEIEELLSLVEFGLDFTHEDAGVLSPEEIRARIGALARRVAELAGPDGAETAQAAESAVLNAGFPRILLLGPTNAGKSSLFNRLLGRDAAIVSPQRHTTRDTVEAALELSNSGHALLIDSAGCGVEVELSAQDASLGTSYLRQAALSATLAAVRGADIILLALDRSVPWRGQPELAWIEQALAQARPATLAVVWTKADLAAASGWRPDDDILAGCAVVETLKSIPRFEVSSLSGAGIEPLREYLAASTAQVNANCREAAIAAATAARAAAKTASDALARAGAALVAGHGEDLVAVELREAIHAFWQAEGVLIRHDAVTEAALDRIFARFCIGK